MKKITAFLFLILVFAAPIAASAAEMLQDQVSTVKAQVVNVLSQDSEPVPGTDTNTDVQTIEVKLLEGPDSGATVTFRNDYVMMKPGDLFFLMKTVVADNGLILYAVAEPYRLNIIYICVGLFVLLAVIFGGKQGIRGLVSLAGSLVLILYAYLPGILHGYSPILMSIGISSLIIIIGSYVTHGFTKTTSAAVIGMIVTVLVTGILAHYFISAAHLTGFETEEATYLNFDTRGHLDFVGLLLGGMLIGFLGILYDAAISQSIAVEELHSIAPHVSRWTIYRRAIRMGKEHIGALVNTLAIAYVGVSLPILLIFSESVSPFLQLVNRENFATEIIRTMIGSIGLILAVPITTLLSVWLLIKKDGTASAELIKKEEEKVENIEHHH